MVAAVATLPSGAAECDISSSDAIELPTSQSRPLYLATEGGIALYEETNGVPELQRRDAAVDDTCGGAIPADTTRAFVAIL
jgi:hypothetical protein